MTTSLQDFEGGDLGQYFGDTYVKVRHKGLRKAGIIRGFVGTNVVVNDPNTGDMVLPIADVDWEGLYPPRCVAYNHCLYFIGPSGNRTYKKPPTTRNMVGMCYSNRGTPYLCGRGTGRDLNPELIHLYLNDTISHPSTSQELEALLEYGNRAIALTPSLGMMYNRDGTWSFIKNCIVLDRCDGDWPEVIARAMELAND